jgi:hypothetical protein
MIKNSTPGLSDCAALTGPVHSTVTCALLNDRGTLTRRALRKSRSFCGGNVYAGELEVRPAAALTTSPTLNGLTAAATSVTLSM